MAAPTKLQTGFQLLTKDFLRFWMGHICLEGHGSRPAPQNRHKAHPTKAGGNWGWDRQRDKSHCTRGECTHQAPVAWAAQAWESTKHRPNWVCAFVEYLKTGTARNAWPASYRASWSLNSVDGERTHPWEGANPVWPEHCECSPHRPMKFVFSAPSSPQHDWTSESKQETTSSRLCQGRN